MRKIAQVRPAGSRRRVVITVVVGAVVAVLAAVVAYQHAWWWLVVAGAGVIALLQFVYPVLAPAPQTGTSAKSATRGKFQHLAGRRHDRLPLVAEVNLEARAHQAVHPIPYVRRDKEEELQACLRRGDPVLLVGSSMVGKTRMAAAVVRSMFADRPVAIPDTNDALADLQAAGVRLRQVVVWLDDINNLLGTGGITLGQLDWLVEQENIVVATIRASEYDRYRPSDQLRLPESDVLDRFTTVFLQRDLTKGEQHRLDQAVADARTKERIRQVGIGEYVGAARQIAEALRLTDASPASRTGLALVHAAADWNRCGAVNRVPESALAALAPPYLDARGREELSSQAGYQDGLSWAKRSINPTVSLLRGEDDDSISVDDYALDLLAEEDKPIPAATWQLVMQHVSRVELLRVGFTASARFGLPDLAIQAFRQVTGSDSDLAAQVAGVGLGQLLSDRGDLDGARAAWLQVTAGQDRTLATVAATSLAEVLEQHRDVPGAAAAWRLAIDLGDPDVAPAAEVSLAGLLRQNGDVPGAIAALLHAADSGHAEIAPSAAASAGALLALRDDVPGATAAFRRALSSGHPDFAPAAGLSLGLLLADHADIPGAMDAWQQVTAFGQPGPGIKAANYLAAQYIRQKDWPAAIVVLRQAIEFGDTDEAPRTAVSLGISLSEHADFALVRSALELGIGCRNIDISVPAALALGSILAERGDVPAARALLQPVIDSGKQPAAASAALALGTLLSENGDVKGARAAYQRAIESKHPEIAPIAQRRLSALS